LHSGKLQINQNSEPWRKRLMIATPTEGSVRYEWVHARFGQVIPVNWAASDFSVNYVALGYWIDDAYNLICKQALDMAAEWLFFIEDDVVLPPDCFVKIAEYVNHGKDPVVSGLYFTKGRPAEPLIFRGRGNGAFRDFKLGAKVRCDGVPMGCLLVHSTLIQWLWNHSEEYQLPDGQTVSRVFETPRKTKFNPATWTFDNMSGTQDLYWCDRLMQEDVFKKCGWSVPKKYPFLVDTSIFCKHIDRGTGKHYPIVLEGELPWQQ